MEKTNGELRRLPDSPFLATTVFQYNIAQTVLLNENMYNTIF